jgi:ribosomal peptide maturation radical SAM protein 1
VTKQGEPREIDLKSVLRDADALLLVPPFAGIERASLGLHLLQACAREQGFEVLVLYTNLLFAREAGKDVYTRLGLATVELFGEQIFARSAFPELSSRPAQRIYHDCNFNPHLGGIDELIEKVEPLQAIAAAWIDKVVQAILPFSFKVVGCSICYEQLTTSLALLNRLKQYKPETIAIIGGASCRIEAAEAMLSLSPSIDYVFAGESESSFTHFLNQVRLGELPDHPVVEGDPYPDLDLLPTPNFDEFYDQRQQFLPVSQDTHEELWLSYETSRGCWWGAKHQCKFCGEHEVEVRKKSPGRVKEELSTLTKKYPSTMVLMADTILPHDYFKTLLPTLGESLGDANIYYQTKANLSFEQVVTLKKAGVNSIQAGIESLSTDLLKLMRKGVTSRQNIALLRFARSVTLQVSWAILYGFPGDCAEYYKSTLALIPLLHHLIPPVFFPMILMRYSPFYEQLTSDSCSCRSLPVYEKIFPEHIDHDKIAIYCEGDFDTAVHSEPELINALRSEVDRWHARWANAAQPPPNVSISSEGNGSYLLLDTRGLPATKEVQEITREQAAAAMLGGSSLTDEIAWAIEHSLCVELDSRYVPLATASYETYQELNVGISKSRQT